jgi:pyrimidine-nucleoside phosphorylase
MAGNWIELAECMDLLRGKRPPESQDLRELSLILAGWMLHLGGLAETPEAGVVRAGAALVDGSALRVFLAMVEAQGGDVSVFDDPGFHKPGATGVLEAAESGYIAEMDTTTIGWAVQRLGAGREVAGEAVDAHAGIEFLARRGVRVKKHQPIATLYATNETRLAEPLALLKRAITFSEEPPEDVELVGRIFTRESAEAYLREHAATNS